MTTLYYQPASSSITIIPSDPLTSIVTFDGIDLRIYADQYNVSGSASMVNDLRAHIFTGSTLLASYPINDVIIYYSASYSANDNDPIFSRPTQSTFPVQFTFIPNTISEFITPIDNFTISGSSYTSSYTQSYVAGGIFLNVNTNYILTLSGSGQFYDSSLTILDISSATTSSYITSSNSYISASFSSSNFNTYNIVAQTQTLPGFRASFSSSASIPVSPTSSLSAWNTYLNISASRISSSGNTFWIVGNELYNNSGSIVITGSGLNDYYGFGMDNIISYSLYNNKLSSFPNVVTSSGTIYFNVDTNFISGTLPNLATTNSLYLQTLIASNNKLSGSIPSLSGSFNLQYFDVSGNYLTGSINLNKCYNLRYFDVHSNKLSGSILDITSSCNNLQEFYCHNNYLTGSLPSLTSSLYSLTKFRCNNNQFVGNIPASYGTQLTTFIGNDNKFTGYEGSMIWDAPLSGYITYFDVSNNLLTQATVDQLLYELDLQGIISGSAYLNGTGNAAPSNTGLSYTSSLKSKGWTVYVN